SSEEVMNKTTATCNNRFLSNRSESLPHTGVEAVEASKVAVTTHVYCDWVPFSDPTIWGSATPTIVPLSMVTPKTVSSPTSDRRTDVSAESAEPKETPRRSKHS